MVFRKRGERIMIYIFGFIVFIIWLYKCDAQSNILSELRAIRHELFMMNLKMKDDR
jgi:hypothetical protein